MLARRQQPPQFASIQQSLIHEMPIHDLHWGIGRPRAKLVRSCRQDRRQASCCKDQGRGNGLLWFDVGRRPVHAPRSRLADRRQYGGPQIPIAQARRTPEPGPPRFPPLIRSLTSRQRKSPGGEPESGANVVRGLFAQKRLDQKRLIRHFRLDGDEGRVGGFLVTTPGIAPGVEPP